VDLAAETTVEQLEAKLAVATLSGALHELSQKEVAKEVSSQLIPLGQQQQQQHRHHVVHFPEPQALEEEQQQDQDQGLHHVVHLPPSQQAEHVLTHLPTAQHSGQTGAEGYPSTDPCQLETQEMDRQVIEPLQVNTLPGTPHT
jgi:hypothetical protein